MRTAVSVPNVTRVELITDPGALEPLEPEWRELAVRTGNAFVTPEWFGAWWRHYGDGHEPLVCVARDLEGRLRGLLPLVASGASASTARFAGSGLGDLFHPVAAASDEAAVAVAAGLELRERRGVPTLVLENVVADAGWWQDLSASLGIRSRPLVHRPSVLPSANLAGRTFEEYLAARSRNLRSQVGRKRRALEREHEVRIRWTRESNEVSADVATLFRLHDSRWRARPGASSLSGASARAFHSDFAALSHARGWLRLCFLEVDGEPVAAWYGWRLGERFAYYQAGFDPSWAGASVGFVLFAETIRAACVEGAGHYDMLLGDEPYKARFADSTISVCTALVAPILRPARMLGSLESGLRRASQRLPARVREPVKARARSLLDGLPMARRR